MGRCCSENVHGGDQGDQGDQKSTVSFLPKGISPTAFNFTILYLNTPSLMGRWFLGAIHTGLSRRYYRIEDNITNFNH